MDQKLSESEYATLRSGLSLRAKVTLWIVIAFAIVKVTLVFVIILYQRQAVQKSFDSAFATRVQAVSRDISEHAGPLDEPYLRGIALRETNNIYIQDFSVLIFDVENAVPVSSFGRDSPMLIESAGDVSELEGITGIVYLTRINDNGLPFRVAAHLIELVDGKNVLLMLATSDRYTSSVTNAVVRVMLISTPFTIGVIAVVAWFVGGAAVRPLEQVRAFAEHLNPEGLGTPIDLSDSGKEVGALREQLDGAMRRLDAAYQSQARFLANISHEIKTPISVVQSEADVLLMSRPGLDEYQEFVRSTGEEMQRLGRMVESFLLLTRVQQGDTRVKRSEIAVNDLVMEAFDQCLKMARQYNVKLEPELCEDDDSPSVFGNQDLLVTAINNLVRNAIRFSPEDAPIKIRCSAEHGKACVNVIDQGSGIPEELLPKIFAPFTQAASERQRGRGTGLGLQIAKGIAELHGGDIKAENLAVGCQFRLELPILTQLGSE